ncbi:T9SS C-terminal target domain-containing protein [Pontibacter diazotrophicus]|uniref:T9SS C-terminal target domain-containing protein n=1 Tax=Pontibacter diazotrophicus TaxID=1400979 RepID=A0A3D8LBZ4_9BACT|nr:S8 family serine peptidase [Pontibacter diazotrophicus]RDV14814.1 T9SS C-terminal target domain-containing protein [Pontibacter diazotrophicus]
MRQLLLFFSLFLLVIPAVSAQDTGGDTEAVEQKHLIYFTDKSDTPFSLSNPLQFLSPSAIERRQRQNIPLTPRDLPVNPAYVDGLKALDVTVWYTSRWFNAAVVQCTDEKLQEVEALSYVRGSRVLNRIAVTSGEEKQHLKQETEAPPFTSAAKVSLDSSDYGLAYHQVDMLGADELHAAGYAGEEMTIAVFDAGFPAVNTMEAFSHLFQNNKLKGTFDFVQKQQNVFGADAHGTAVLSTMAAYAPGKMIGTAYAANYLLLRTEDAASEHNIEEINWLLAAEYADSAGADIINSSLGYTTFDSPSTSYTYDDLDGNTALASKAADFAAATGILVVASAGNDGSRAWRYISAPADADSVLAVGAVDSLGIKAAFSSFGPTADGQVKPDVVALGQRAYVLTRGGAVVQANGTSFAAPIMAGFVASLWQANYSKTNMQMIQLLRQIGSRAATPDDSIGYGIPNYASVLTALPQLPLQGKAYISNPVKDEPIILALSQDWWRQGVEVQVLDATGKQVYRQSIRSAREEQPLNLQPQQLKAGLYLCRLRSGSRVITLRFVKL